MKKYVLLCGPQAAGKSTCVGSLRDFLLNLYPCLPLSAELGSFCLQESRQIIVRKYHAMGGIFLTVEQEREIIATDLYRMTVITRELDDSTFYVDETNVFTLAHAKVHGIDLFTEFWPQYMALLKELQAVVVFMDIDPATSWQRRKHIYKNRLYRFPQKDRRKILKRFEEYLGQLYPELLDIYEKLEIPKIKVSACQSHAKVMREILTFLFSAKIL